MDRTEGDRLIKSLKTRKQISDFAEHRLEFAKRCLDDETNNYNTDDQLDAQTYRDVLYLLISLSIAVISFSVPFFYQTKLVHVSILYFIGLFILSYTAFRGLTFISVLLNNRTTAYSKYYKNSFDYLHKQLMIARRLAQNPNTTSLKKYIESKYALDDTFRPKREELHKSKIGYGPVSDFTLIFLTGVTLIFISLIDFVGIFNFVNSTFKL